MFSFGFGKIARPSNGLVAKSMTEEKTVAVVGDFLPMTEAMEVTIDNPLVIG